MTATLSSSTPSDRRYHLTARGEPALCRASKRPCPRGGSSAHYSTPQEARQAFEGEQQREEGLRRAAHRLAQVVAHGREALGNEALWQEPWRWAKAHGFTFIAMGSQRAVFHHKETDKVIKVVASQQFSAHDLARAEQEALATLADRKLLRAGVRYHPTSYYTTPDGTSVVAQDYLSPERYRPFHWEALTPEQTALLAPVYASEGGPLGLGDLYEENAVIDGETGEVVLFDCLDVAAHFYDYSWSPEDDW